MEIGNIHCLDAKNDFRAHKQEHTLIYIKKNMNIWINMYAIFSVVCREAEIEHKSVANCFCGCYATIIAVHTSTQAIKWKMK